MHGRGATSPPQPVAYHDFGGSRDQPAPGRRPEAKFRRFTAQPPPRWGAIRAVYLLQYARILQERQHLPADCPTLELRIEEPRTVAGQGRKIALAERCETAPERGAIAARIIEPQSVPLHQVAQISAHRIENGQAGGK